MLLNNILIENLRFKQVGAKMLHAIEELMNGPIVRMITTTYDKVVVLELDIRYFAEELTTDEL